MARQPVIYLHRITDGAYFIYKLSNHDYSYPIKLIAVGMAFDGMGNYTNKFKKLQKKYVLEKYASNTHTTSDSYEDFLQSLYLDHRVGSLKIPIPRKALYVTECAHERINRNRDEKVVDDLELSVLRSNTHDRIIEKLKKLKDVLQ